jgi:hypothetical protein
MFEPTADPGTKVLRALLHYDRQSAEARVTRLR